MAASDVRFFSVQPPRHWLSPALAVGLLLLCLAGSAPAQVWAKTGAPNKSWIAAASSADGNKLVAAFQGSSGGIYLSTNAGATWTAAAVPAKYWTGLASSADGGVLLAVASYNGTTGGVYTSTNSGGTWVSNAVPVNFYQMGATAVSASGKTLIVGVVVSSPGLAYYSTNMGATWSSNGLPTGGYWSSVACTGDGAVAKLAADWGGTLYSSTNGGATWANNNLGGSSILVSSADASHLFLYGSGMSVSTNWGASWQSASQPNGYMQLASSSDAKRLVGLYAGNVYVSTDFGATWLMSYAPNKTWKSIGLAADGTKMVAVPSATSDGIYVWQPPVLNYTNNAGSVTLAWPTNGTTFTLQTLPNLMATNWVNVGGSTVSNSLRQVTLPLTNDSGFYRLQSP
jgi:hypothetical protein